MELGSIGGRADDASFSLQQVSSETLEFSCPGFLPLPACVHPGSLPLKVREEEEITEVPGRLPRAEWQVWPAKRVESGGATISLRRNRSRATAETRTCSAKNVLIRVAKRGCRNGRGIEALFGEPSNEGGVGPHRTQEAQNQLNHVLASLRFAFLGGAIGLVEPPDRVAQIGVAE